MTARDDLVGRVRILTSTLGAEALQVRDLADTDALNAARVLRNGLMVVTFASIEDFIRSRAEEIMDFLSRAAIPFTALPDRVRKVATIDAIDGLDRQVAIVRQRGGDVMEFVQLSARSIASTLGDPYSLTALGLGRSVANLSEAEIGAMLKTFGIDRPWEQMTQLASRLGFGALPLRDSFRAAALARHAAAHEPAAGVALGDLRSHIRQATAIGLAFDLLISRAARLLADRVPDVLSGDRRIDATAVAIRILDERANGWAEFLEGARRAWRIHADLEMGIAAASARARRESSALVVRDRTQTPTRWVTPDV